MKEKKYKKNHKMVEPKTRLALHTYIWTKTLSAIS